MKHENHNKSIYVSINRLIAIDAPTYKYYAQQKYFLLDCLNRRYQIYFQCHLPEVFMQTFLIGKQMHESVDLAYHKQKQIHIACKMYLMVYMLRIRSIVCCRNSMELLFWKCVPSI